MQITTKLDKAKIQQHLDIVLSTALTQIVENLAHFKLNENSPETKEYQSVYDWFSFDEEKLGKALEEKHYSLIKYMSHGPLNRMDPFGHNPPGLVTPMNPSWPPQPQPRFQSMAPAHGQMPVQPGLNPYQMTPMQDQGQPPIYRPYMSPGNQSDTSETKQETSS